MKQSLLGALALAGTLAACSGSMSPTGNDVTSLTGRDLVGQDSTSARGQDSPSGGPTEPDPDSAHNGSAWVRVIGTLAESVNHMVPDQARPGEPFSITVSTTNPDICIKDAGTEVTVQDGLARVVAYDSVPSPPMLCGAAISGVRHNATVRFESPGKATVRVVGYMGWAAKKWLDSLDYTVTVGP